MGLAPFGDPRHADVILSELVEAQPDGSFRLNPRYFAYLHGHGMTTRRFHRLFGGDPRPLGAPPGRREADLAASIQVATEQLLLGLARRAKSRTGASALCLGGGVALTCVANAVVRRDARSMTCGSCRLPGTAGAHLARPTGPGTRWSADWSGPA